MAVIEGFRVQNYRALLDVTLGKLSNQQAGEPLTPFTVVIGKNGVGKSTLMEPDRNVSPSFCKFRDGLRQLCTEG